jgi:hypothetical protein
MFVKNTLRSLVLSLTLLLPLGCDTQGNASTQVEQESIPNSRYIITVGQMCTRTGYTDYYTSIESKDYYVDTYHLEGEVIRFNCVDYDRELIFFSPVWVTIKER